jgi:hypothetical protein
MPEITREQRALFDEQGHIVVGPLVPPEQVARLRRAFEEQAAAWAAEIDTPLDDYLSVVSQWTNVWEHNAVFRAQMFHQRAAAIAAELIGCEKVRVFHDHLIVKPPHGGDTIPWHRDLPNWPVAEPRAVSCWLALDDVTAEAGAMRFMPGGHKEPMTRSIDFLNEAKAWGDREKDAVPVPVPAGLGDLPPLPVVAHEPAQRHGRLAARLHHHLHGRDLHLRPRAGRLAPRVRQGHRAAGRSVQRGRLPDARAGCGGGARGAGRCRMNRIQMYASSTHLKHGLHRVLAVAHALTSPVEPGESAAWWSLLDADEQERGMACTRCRLDALARLYARDAVRAVLDAGRAAVGLPALDHAAVQAAFKVAIISGKAHRAHMGRDVYGSSNKGLWDLVCARLRARGGRPLRPDAGRRPGAARRERAV